MPIETFVDIALRLRVVLGTVRCKLIQRASHLTRPEGQLTLTMSANPVVRSELLHYLDALKSAA